MRLVLVTLAVLTTSSLLLGSPEPGLAQASCQFTLGFKDLHDAMPDVVGNCQDDPTTAPNGDLQQHTSRGLLIWRPPENWTSFTDGNTTWIQGPYGLQQRPNSQHFEWERAQSGPHVVTSDLNVVRGQDLFSDVVWLMGTVANDGGKPAYDVALAARLLDDGGGETGTASETVPTLAPGDEVGFRLVADSPAAFSKTDFKVTYAAETSNPPLVKLTLSGPSAQPTQEGLKFNTTVANRTDQPVNGLIYVWFMDANNKVVWADRMDGVSLPPGASTQIAIETQSRRFDPQVQDIRMARAKGFGRPS